MQDGLHPTIELRFRLNGEAVARTVPTGRLLLELLREDLGLTGTKENCSIGVCGVCSVLLDGEPVSACLMPAILVDEREVTTVEGLAGRDGSLSRLQEAFIDHGGSQCGMCTPGQLVVATSLLRENPSPTEAEIREYMTGNLCRCTGYYRIVESVMAAAEVGAVRPSDA